MLGRSRDCASVSFHEPVTFCGSRVKNTTPNPNPITITIKNTITNRNHQPQQPTATTYHNRQPQSPTTSTTTKPIPTPAPFRTTTTASTNTGVSDRELAKGARGAADRRRERRVHMFGRHEQLSLKMAFGSRGALKDQGCGGARVVQRATSPDATAGMIKITIGTATLGMA